MWTEWMYYLCFGLVKYSDGTWRRHGEYFVQDDFGYLVPVNLNSSEME